MGISKVVFDGDTLIDLTNDTVTDMTLLNGVTAHNANGDPIVGEMFLGALAKLDFINYQSDYLVNKPVLGSLASKNSIDYNSNYITNKPDRVSVIMNKILELYPEMPKRAIIAIYASDGILWVDSSLVIRYSNEKLECTDQEVDGIRLVYGSERLIIRVSEDASGNYLDDAPNDGNKYVRRDGEWVPETPWSKSDGSVEIDLSSLGNLAFKDHLNYEELQNKPERRVLGETLIIG